ncbi:hypothetical protein JRI60_49930 [Archangium violaceum]|uniref:hypothetical protein n=1 Tax=Archangium violaceum TaxID=83451 RepID=UPI001951AFE6|nr:hypothetical protein [Archangium violaceum]QRN96998.1 hypothetical protein JRI60_49930 [Archangium violaceum]
MLFSSAQGGTRADADDFFTVRLSAADKVEIDMGGYCNNNMEVGGLPAAAPAHTVVLSSAVQLAGAQWTEQWRDQLHLR